MTTDSVPTSELTKKLNVMLGSQILTAVLELAEHIRGFKKEHDAWEGKGSVGAETAEMGKMIPVIYTTRIANEVVKMVNGDADAPQGFLDQFSKEVATDLDGPVQKLKEAITGTTADLGPACALFIQDAAEVIAKMVMTEAPS
ncbi:hypothetical protein ACFL6I_26845 [candidate division KSB1 bacterium]